MRRFEGPSHRGRVIRKTLSWLTTSILLAGAPTGAAVAADEDSAARLREMLHRTQEALRQAQSDNAELARAKNDAEQKLLEASKQMDSAQNGAKAAQASLSAKLTAAEGARAEDARKLTDTAERLAAANTKLAAAAKELAATTAELATVKLSLEQSNTANASCENKNLTLYGYSEDLLKQYKNKGVWAALAQKDPVLGLKNVDIENVVQEYRLKFDSQKVKP
jgi:chromosome segregation ATPase